MIIYKITNKLNGKIYIGQTVRTLEERFQEHRRKHSILSKAIKKYGDENFLVEQIDSANNIDELNEKEIYWIEHYDCMNPNGYNQCEGGGNTQGYHHKEASKKKMSLNKKGKYTGINNHYFGKTHSPEARKKMSLSRTGRIINDEWRKNLSDASTVKREVINVDTLEIFDSCKAAAKQYNIPSTNISRACRGKRPTCRGYRWMYKDEYDAVKDTLTLKPLNEFMEDVKRNQTKTAGHNKRKVINLESLDIFDSMTAAAKSCGLKSSVSILNVCRGKTKTAGGFRWMYYDEYMAIPSQARENGKV